METLDAEDSRVELAIAGAACLPHLGEDRDQATARYDALREITSATRWFIASEELTEDQYRDEWRGLFAEMQKMPGVKVQAHSESPRTLARRARHDPPEAGDKGVRCP